MNTGKGMVWGMVVLALFIIWGNSLEDTPVVKKAWLPRKTEKRVVRKATKSLKTHKRSWDTHKKEQSEEWVDFLETLENRGYDIWDPEAEDIWTEFH